MASVSPKSVIQRFAELLHLQILYMESAGKHEAILPNFLQSNCLQKNLSSEIEYDLGSESQFKILKSCQHWSKEKLSQENDMSVLHQLHRRA